jgi:hypothetical protein
VAHLEKAGIRACSERAADGAGECCIILTSSLTASLDRGCFVVEGDPSPIGGEASVMQRDDFMSEQRPVLELPSLARASTQ